MGVTEAWDFTEGWNLAHVIYAEAILATKNWATKLTLHLNCSKAALTILHEVLSSWKLVELEMLDFNDCARIENTILTSAAD